MNTREADCIASSSYQRSQPSGLLTIPPSMRRAASGFLRDMVSLIYDDELLHAQQTPLDRPVGYLLIAGYRQGSGGARDASGAKH